MLLQNVYYATLVVVAFSVIYMITQYRDLKAMSEGTKQMSEIALKIRNGSTTFLKTIYPRIIIVALILAGLIAWSVDFEAGLDFLLGLVLTTISVVVGLTVSTLANVRTTAKAYENKDQPKEIAGTRTTGTTVKGSQICGIIVHNHDPFCHIIILP